MRLRPFLILLFFAVFAGILAWVFIASTRAPKSKAQSPWLETRNDLHACGREKHVQAVQYERFANIASVEHRPEVERLFRAIAYSKQVQERNCAMAVGRLGGSYTPPTKVVVFEGRTDDNLARSITYEQQLLHERRPSEIGRAMGRGNRYAARVLIWTSAADMRQVMLMERCRDRAATGKESTYCVCPGCANLYEEGYDDAYCPHCLTGSVRFIRIE